MGPISDTMAFDKLVLVGASAGGIDALSTLVSSLPTGFPAPIVIAQHLDPTRPSHLAEILSARSPIPVREVKNQEPLEAGIVFVVPPNRHVEINDHAVTVIEDHGGRPLPSIDLALTTAAAVFGEGLVAVIPTGSGADGAAGARDVKASGGIVVIQDPATAAYPSMPLALAPNVVDIVSDLKSLGPLLFDLLTGKYVVQPAPEDAALQAILTDLREQSGIDFASYKLPTITRRLRHRMLATGSTDLDAYRRYLARYPEENQKLINSFLIKVTEFFRDRDLYDNLREHLLPTLLADAQHRKELRIWSAGCATGEEPYSLAILLTDLLGEDLHRLKVRIFATDVDADAIAFARRGIYPASALAQLPAETINRYFTPVEGAYEVRQHVRALVVFGQHDLGQRSPFPRIDLALCRNVLIYFTPELQKRALQLFAFSLREGGLLVLGKAETVAPLGEVFSLEHPRLRIYRRIGDKVLIPSSRIRSAIPTPTTTPISGRSSFSGIGQASSRFNVIERARERTAGPKADQILQGLAVGLVIVDRHYDIQMINTSARSLLGIHTGAVGQDFIHLLRDPSLLPLRTAIDEALAGRPSPPMVYTLPAPDVMSGETRYLEITCSGERLGGIHGAPDSVVIQVVDVTPFAGEARRLEQEIIQQEEERNHRLEQIRRLSASIADLMAANRELAETNTVLRGANEELLVTNEEIQAAAEEVETLNEEMQATNEELETLNEEMQATVEELNTTNEDLEARSLEMHDLAVSLEAQRQASETERTRLDAVLRSIDDGVLVVDGLGQTVLANEASQRLFGSTETDPPLEREPGQPLPPDTAPRQRAARGETFSEELTYLGPDGTRRWIEAKGTPIRAEEGQERGVVVIRDITERSLRRLGSIPGDCQSRAAHPTDRTPGGPATPGASAPAAAGRGAAAQARGAGDAAGPTHGDPHQRTDGCRPPPK